MNQAIFDMYVPLIINNNQVSSFFDSSYLSFKNIYIYDFPRSFYDCGTATNWICQWKKLKMSRPLPLWDSSVKLHRRRSASDNSKAKSCNQNYDFCPLVFSSFPNLIRVSLSVPPSRIGHAMVCASGFPGRNHTASPFVERFSRLWAGIG